MEKIIDIIKEIEGVKYSSSIMPSIQMPNVMANEIMMRLNKFYRSLQRRGAALGQLPQNYTEMLGYSISGPSGSLESIKENITSRIKVTHDEKVKNDLMGIFKECQELLSYLNLIVHDSESLLTKEDSLGTFFGVVSTSAVPCVEKDQINGLIHVIEMIQDNNSKVKKTHKDFEFRYLLCAFLVLLIVVIAIVLTVVLFHNSIGASVDDECEFCWYEVIWYLIALLIVAIFAICCFRCFKVIAKSHELYFNNELKRENELDKKKSDIFDLQLSSCKHRLHQIELQEQINNTCLDEYVRDKEHVRKIELKEQERTASFADKIIELGKINMYEKKSVDDNNGGKRMSGGKTETTEKRSLLS